ncbi:hypothetical protein Hdeb2414_s0010g00336751 [Helianthus debilis subsp. tardiflorus]
MGERLLPVMSLNGVLMIILMFTRMGTLVCHRDPYIYLHIHLVESGPTDDFAGHEAGDGAGPVVCSFPSNGILLTELNKTTSKSNVGQPHTNQSRRTVKNILKYAPAQFYINNVLPRIKEKMIMALNPFVDQL